MTRYIFLFILLTLLTISPAMADTPIVACGEAVPAELETDLGGEYCDIYARQRAYGQEEAKFRKLLKERQENFARPGIKAAANYREAIRKSHGFAKPGEEQAEPGSEFGPPEQEPADPNAGTDPATHP